MDDVTRRQAMKFAATTGVVTTGAVVLSGGNAHAAQDDGEAEDYGYTDVEATPEEQQAFEAFQANRPAGLLAEEFVDAIPIHMRSLSGRSTSSACFTSATPSRTARPRAR